MRRCRRRARQSVMVILLVVSIACVIFYFDGDSTKVHQRVYISTSNKTLRLNSEYHWGPLPAARVDSSDPVINPLNTSVLLMPRAGEDCAGSVDYFIFVHSDVQHFSLRSRIRKTWGQTGKVWNQYTEIYYTVITIFVVGLTTEDEVLASLEDEISEYSDILIGDFKDEYLSLNTKSRIGMRYAAQFCPKAKFVIKSDDDMLIDIGRIVNFTQSVKEVSVNTIFCKVWWKIPVKRKHSHIRFVSEKKYPAEYYPPFCSGSTVVMTHGVPAVLDVNVNYVPDVPGDDVMIYGLARNHTNKLFLKDVTKRYRFGSFGKRNITTLTNDGTVYYFHGFDDVNYHKVWNFINLPDRLVLHAPSRCRGRSSWCANFRGSS